MIEVASFLGWRPGLRALPAISAFLMIGVPSEAQPREAVRFVHLGVEQGLAHTTVWDVEQDHRGFVWLATQTALQRYDGYELRGYPHDPSDPHSPTHNEILALFEDRGGELWGTTREQGLVRYDRGRDRFVRYPARPGDPSGLPADFVNDLSDGPEGDLWLATYESGLVRLDPATGTARAFRHDPEDPASLGADAVEAVHLDRFGVLWVGNAVGLDRWDPETETFVHHRPVEELLGSTEESELGNDIVAICESPEGELWVTAADGDIYSFDRDSGSFEARTRVVDGWADLVAPDGRIWISTFSSGLVRFDPVSGQLDRWTHDADDPDSLSSNFILNLAQDRSGQIWIATRDGISLYDARRSRFRVARHRPRGDGLAGRVVTAVLQDRRGVVWVGTQDGNLTAWDPASDVFETFTGLGSTKIGSVQALWESPTEELWVGGEEGLARIGATRRTAVRLAGIDTDVTVRDILEDAEGTLWLGTLGMGLVRFGDPGGGRRDGSRVEPLPFEPSTPVVGASASGISNSTNLGTLPSDSVNAVAVASDGFLWAATSAGLSRVDSRTGEIRTWRHDPANPDSLSENWLADLLLDGVGRLWMATYGGGFERFDPASGVFHHHRRVDGLIDDNVVSVLEDAAGHLWIATTRGLSHFDPASRAFRSYDVGNGLSSHVFMSHSRTKTADGLLIFGGHNGLTAFDPGSLEEPAEPAPPVVITEMFVDGEVVRPAGEGSPLALAVTETEALTLGYRQRTFAFEFAAPQFTNPERTRFAFRLEGWDSDWIETGAANRRARYTNLDAGDYVFQVRAGNRDGVWSEAGASLRLQILPPPWKTAWAYALYAAALFGGIFLYTGWQHRRLERERQVNDRLRQVGRLKNQFLANTSHELRTPLYGIIGLAEALLDGARGEPSSEAREDLSMIVASGRRLGSLVDDILDFSRLRDHEIELDRRAVDLHADVELVLALLRPLTGGKRLELVNAVPSTLPAAWADENRLQQILLNLVGNAVKFTDRGRVEVSAGLVGDDSEGGTDAYLRVVVSDTGPGITPAQQERIFEPFEQVDASTERAYGGTGLGLAISRHLVELHGGRLTVESVPGEGSRFAFTLPEARAISDSTSTAQETRDAVRRMDPLALSGQSAATPAPVAAADSRETLLVVDDEALVRQVFVTQLEPLGYRVLQARSGPEALEMMEQGPDLVLLDIMMPHMSGFEVCRRIRERHSLETLPVIYLTAKNQIEDLVEGFASGSNDFLAKPVIREELVARVRTHLDLIRLHRAQERALEDRTEEVKVLSGLLPICASCKKIRDEDGAWSELGEYLDKHSDARLTHGICTECARSLFPELDHS